MADDVTFQSSTLATPPASTVVATDDVGGVHYQKVKIALGADGVEDLVVDSGQQTMANSLPVAIASNQSELTVALGAVDNAVLDSIDADLTTIIGHVDGLEGLLTTIDTSLNAIEADVDVIKDAVYDDDDAFVLAFDSVMMAGAIRDGTLSLLDAVDGDAIPLRANDYGALWVSLADVNGENVTMFSTQADSQSNSANALLTANFLYGFDGANWSRARLSTTEGLLVQLGPTDNAVLDSMVTSLQLLDDIVLAEDAAHQTGDKGVMLLAVRQDAQADFGADGDYVPLSIDADGQLRVAASFEAAASASEYLDDEAFTLTTDAVTAIGAIRDDALTTLSAVEGDVVVLRVDDEGKLWVNAGTVSATAESEYADDAAFTLTSSKLTAVGGIKDNALGALAAAEGDAVPFRVNSRGALWTALTDTDGDAVDVIPASNDNIAASTIGLFTIGTNYLYDGSTWDRAPGNATDGQLVNLGSNNDVTVTGTVDLGATDNAVLDSIDADLTTIIGHVDGIEGLLTTIDADTGNIVTAVQLIDDAIFADDAAFTLTTSKVMMAGGIRDANLSSTAAADNDAMPLRLNSFGALWTINAEGGYTYIGDSSGFASVTTTQADNLSNGTDTLNVSAFGYVFDGSTWDRQLGNSTDGTLVNLGSNNDVTITSHVPGTSATNLGKAEDAGHTTGDTGVYVLGVRNDTPNVALTNADADYGSIALYRTGAVRTAIPEEDFAALGSNHVKKYYSNTGAVTDGIVWSPAAGKRWYVTDLILTTSAAATVTFEDDLGAGDSTVLALDLAANSGLSHHFATPLFSGEDAADLLVTTTAGNIKITVVGYEI